MPLEYVDESFCLRAKRRSNGDIGEVRRLKREAQANDGPIVAERYEFWPDRDGQAGSIDLLNPGSISQQTVFHDSVGGEYDLLTPI